MKTRNTFLGALVISAFAVQANAGIVYTHTNDLVTNPPAGVITEIDGELIAAFAYEHLNPTETIAGGPWTPAEYEQAVLDGLIAGATLEIAVDDLDLGELGGVLLLGVDGIIHPLGLLDTMPFADVGGVDPGVGNVDPNRVVSTTFTVDPAWIDGLPVGILFSVDSLIDEFELESSTLAITVVPEPGTLLIVFCGLGLCGATKRRKRSLL